MGVSLRKIASEDEAIAKYATTTLYLGMCECIVPGDVPIEQVDISACLEDTLHRILDAGGTDEDVALIMGAYVPDETERVKLEESGELTKIDLGYVIPGALVTFKAGGDVHV